VPEGDTIFRAAAALDRALGSRELVRFEAPRLRVAPFPAGTVVEGAEAVGKHCLIRFDDGRTLRTHMRMTGSWHLYRPGERWRKAAAAMRALVEVADWQAVCFAAPIVELLSDKDADAAIAHLGPDLCRPDADIDAAVERMARLSPPSRPIGEALLDQRIAAGIGNVYKSEACYVEGVHPFTPVEALDEPSRRRLLETAAAQLRDNLGRVRRSTTDDGRLYVYGRRDRPCRRCGTTIEWAAQGDQRRGTYWCPSCQVLSSGNQA
jgi:endonuclease-8